MNLHLKKPLLYLTLLALLCAGPPALRAGEGVKKLAEPTVEQRLEDLEAYINNTARQADTASNNVKFQAGDLR